MITDTPKYDFFSTLREKTKKTFSNLRIAIRKKQKSNRPCEATAEVIQKEKHVNWIALAIASQGRDETKAS